MDRLGRKRGCENLLDPIVIREIMEMTRQKRSHSILVLRYDMSKKFTKENESLYVTSK